MFKKLKKLIQLLLITLKLDPQFNPRDDKKQENDTDRL